jgi:multiple sugar transport system substrate-binding protein
LVVVDVCGRAKFENDPQVTGRREGNGVTKNTRDREGRLMRVQVYDQLMAMQASRRQVLKGGAAAAIAASSPLGFSSTPAFAADSVVAQIMKIPGAGNGSPTDADWQKVGELCLGPTKANVQPGEFKGIEFSFMGLNNQNLHNFLFRGFLTPWEAYTGAKIKWIDLAQADYNARLQPSTSTSSKWGRRSRATWESKASCRKCPIG